MAASLLLIPIIYFLPLGINIKGKLIIIGTSFLLAELGLLANKIYPLWQTILMLLLITFLFTMFIEKRLRSSSADGSDEYLDQDEYIEDNEKEEGIDRDILHMKVNDVKLGQETIDSMIHDEDNVKAGAEEAEQEETTSYEDTIEELNPVEQLSESKEAFDSIEELESQLVEIQAEDAFEQEDEAHIDTIENEEDEANKEISNANLPDNTVDDNTDDQVEEHVLDEIEIEGSISETETHLIQEESVLENRGLDDLVSDNNLTLDVEKEEDKEEHLSEEEMLKERASLFDELEDDVTNEENVEHEKDALKEVDSIDNNYFLDKIDDFETEEEVQLHETEESKIEHTHDEETDISIEEQKDLPDNNQQIEQVDGKESDKITHDDYIEELYVDELSSEANQEEITEEANDTSMEEIDVIEEIETEDLSSSIEMDQEDKINEDTEDLVDKGLFEIHTADHNEDIEPVNDSKNQEVIPDTDELELIEEAEEIRERQVAAKQVIQQQLFRTMITQVHLMKNQMKASDYEKLIKDHLHPSLSDQDYFTFAHLLIEHYISKRKHHDLQQLLLDLEERFSNYPIIKQEIDYLKNKYYDH